MGCCFKKGRKETDEEMGVDGTTKGKPGNQSEPLID